MTDAERIAALESHLATANERIAEMSGAMADLVRASTEAVRKMVAQGAELERVRAPRLAAQPQQRAAGPFGVRVVAREKPRERTDPEKEF